MSTGISTLPLPRWDGSTVVVQPPSDEPGAWSGAPSSIVADGYVYLAYRVRLPIGEGRGIANVVARSADGVTFTPVAEVTKEQFGAESLERPALVRAFVAAREDVVVDPGQHDARALGLHQSRLPGWQVGQTGHTASAHSSSFATKAR